MHGTFRDLPWQPETPQPDHTGRELAALAMMTGAMLAVLSLLPIPIGNGIPDKSAGLWVLEPAPVREKKKVFTWTIL